MRLISDWHASDLIRLTKSQRDSLLGQLKWVDLETGTFYAHHSARTFLKRIGAVDSGYRLTGPGISLLADFGNLLNKKD